MNKERYAELEQDYMPMDQRRVSRTRNLRLIPKIDNRRGGKFAYGEWCHVIGLFQSLIYLSLKRPSKANILDVGCGTGLLGIASEPYVQEGGCYTGIDVSLRDIDFCKSHYPSNQHYNFIHLDTNNPFYTPGQAGRASWAVDDASQDLVTALSVWTHLTEADATYYFTEIDRVLKPGAKAIITFFYLDETYRDSIASRSSKPGRFHKTPTDTWIFNKQCADSTEWLYPEQLEVPENAIGVTPKGIEKLIEKTTLKHVTTNPGNWKEQPGIFFQNILTFQKES